MNKDIEKIKKALEDPNFCEALNEFTIETRKSVIKHIKKTRKKEE